MPNTVDLPSIHSETLRHVRDRIASLNLLGAPNVAVRKFPWTHNQWFDGITVGWEDETEGSQGTNERDQWGYPVPITMITGTAGSLDSGINLVSFWRRHIRQAFHQKRLGLPLPANVCDNPCIVEPKDVIVPQQFAREQIDVSSLIVWCWFIEARD